jgi:hypothetical protein
VQLAEREVALVFSISYSYNNNTGGRVPVWDEYDCFFALMLFGQPALSFALCHCSPNCQLGVAFALLADRISLMPCPALRSLTCFYPHPGGVECRGRDPAAKG